MKKEAKSIVTNAIPLLYYIINYQMRCVRPLAVFGTKQVQLNLEPQFWSSGLKMDKVEI